MYVSSSLGQCSFYTLIANNFFNYTEYTIAPQNGALISGDNQPKEAKSCEREKEF